MDNNVNNSDLVEQRTKLESKHVELCKMSAEYQTEAANGFKGPAQEALRARAMQFDEEAYIIADELTAIDSDIRHFSNILVNEPTNLLTFFHDRLKVYLRDKGISHDIIDACLAMPNNDDFTLLVKRAEALQGFMKTDDGTNLLQGFKQANNLLTQAEAKDGVEYSYGADVKYAETDVERDLFAALATADKVIEPSIKAEDFATAMAAMAGLRAPIYAFFKAVKINADSDIVRRNRLNLLGQIRKTMAQVADFTRIEG